MGKLVFITKDNIKMVVQERVVASIFFQECKEDFLRLETWLKIRWCENFINEDRIELLVENGAKII